jgi:hypothetical protein
MDQERIPAAKRDYHPFATPSHIQYDPIAKSAGKEKRFWWDNGAHPVHLGTGDGVSYQRWSQQADNRFNFWQFWHR